MTGRISCLPIHPGVLREAQSSSALYEPPWNMDWIPTNTFLTFFTVQADLSKPDVLAALLPENAPLECRSSAPK